MYSEDSYIRDIYIRDLKTLSRENWASKLSIHNLISKYGIGAKCIKCI